MSTIDNKCVELHVIIVGAGIAGLAAAIALKKAGHRVEVFERSKFKNEFGAAITISPNGTRVLQRLGFDFEKAKGVDQKVLGYYDGVTGELTGVMELTEPETPHQAFHRVDLHTQLVELATSEHSSGIPVKIHLGVTIATVDVEKAKIEFQDGRNATGDLLIGADGLHSIVRTAALRSDIPPIDSGWIVQRFLIPTEAIMDDPILKPWRSLNERKIYFFGSPPLTRLVCYECRSGEVQNCVVLSRSDGDTGMTTEDWDNSSSRTNVKKILHNYHSTLLALVDKIDKVTSWSILDREPLPTFIYGKTVLVGDAAHPYSPMTGQGGVQALEDAGALLGLLNNLPSLEALPERLKMFDQVRVLRVSRLQVGPANTFNRYREDHPMMGLSEKLDELDGKPKGLTYLDKETWEWDFRYNIFDKCDELLRKET